MCQIWGEDTYSKTENTVWELTAQLLDMFTLDIIQFASTICGKIKKTIEMLPTVALASMWLSDTPEWMAH